MRSAWLCGSAPPPAIDLTTIEVDDDLGGTGDSGEGSGGKSGGGEEEDAALKVFLAKVWRPVDFLLRAYCSNRSRLRRRARRCLGEWNLLVEPAIAADDSGAIERYLDAYAETNDCDAARALARSAWPKSAMARWTISMMARVEITHLSLGHELELYLPLLLLEDPRPPLDDDDDEPPLLPPFNPRKNWTTSSSISRFTFKMMMRVE